MQEIRKLIAGQKAFQVFWEAIRLGTGTMFRPDRTIPYAAQRKPLLSIAVLTILIGLSLSLGMRLAVAHQAPYPFRDLGWYGTCLYAVTMPLIYWIVAGALLNMFAELIGGTPRGLSILASGACSASPMLLFFPLMKIFVTVAPNLWTQEGRLAWFMMLLILSAWMAVLFYVSIQSTYKFNIRQTLITLFLTFAIAIIPVTLVYSLKQTGDENDSLRRTVSEQAHQIKSLQDQEAN